jgi:hypothetical protein
MNDLLQIINQECLEVGLPCISEDKISSEGNGVECLDITPHFLLYKDHQQLYFCAGATGESTKQILAALIIGRSSVKAGLPLFMGTPFLLNDGNIQFLTGEEDA